MPSTSSERREREPAGLGREPCARTRRRRPRSPGTAPARDHDAARTAPRRRRPSATGSDSPVSSDSSSSSPSTARTIAVGRRPGRRRAARAGRRARRRSTAISRTSPSRTHARRRRAEHREPVERALGPPLLDDADQRVDHEDEAEQPVLRRAEHEDQHEHRAEDRVEPGEDVGPDDLAEGAARAVVGAVDEPAPLPLGDLGRRQTAGPVRWRSPGTSRVVAVSLWPGTATGTTAVRWRIPTNVLFSTMVCASRTACWRRYRRESTSLRAPRRAAGCSNRRCRRRSSGDWCDRSGGTTAAARRRG